MIECIDLEQTSQIAKYKFNLFHKLVFQYIFNMIIGCNDDFNYLVLVCEDYMLQATCEFGQHNSALLWLSLHHTKLRRTIDVRVFLSSVQLLSAQRIHCLFCAQKTLLQNFVAV